MIDPASAVGLANTAFSAVKSAFELAKKTTDLDLKHELSKTLDSVLELKVKVYELAEENRALNDKLNLKASVRRDAGSGFWFKENEIDPLCPRCYEGPNQSVVYLSPSWFSKVSGHVRRCVVCNAEFESSSIP